MLTNRQQAALDVVTKLHGQWDISLLMGMIEHESSFNPAAFANDKNGGSYGLMQLNLITAEDRGFTGTALELYYPPTNVGIGVKQLDWIKEYLEARDCFSIANCVAAFNAGAHAVAVGNQNPLYVQSVLAAAGRWDAILNPKEQPNDGTPA